MGETTNIEWCDANLDLWWGCTKVSGGCKNCYAEKLSDQRYKKGAWGPDESLDPNGAHLKVISSDREYLNSQGSWEPVYQSPSARVMNRVGKARAGRLLDGREWSQFPEVNP